jgi:hypothetical protein
VGDERFLEITRTVSLQRSSIPAKVQSISGEMYRSTVSIDG